MTPARWQAYWRQQQVVQLPCLVSVPHQVWTWSHIWWWVGGWLQSRGIHITFEYSSKWQQILRDGSSFCIEMDHWFASGHQIHEGRACNENTDEKIGLFRWSNEHQLNKLKCVLVQLHNLFLFIMWHSSSAIGDIQFSRWLTLTVVVSHYNHPLFCLAPSIDVCSTWGHPCAALLSQCKYIPSWEETQSAIHHAATIVTCYTPLLNSCQFTV